MNILLVDDQHVVREALAHALASQPGVSEVVQAGSRQEALSAPDLHRCQVAVVELCLADHSGIELIRELKGLAELRLVVLSMHRDEFRVAEAMRAGADGYLSKQSRLADLMEALRTVVRGRTAVSPDVSAAMVRALQRRDAASRGDMVASLSDRERQVLRLLAMGRSAKEVAAQLSISVKTVETHRARLCAKVATHSVADLTRLAVRSGLVEA
ncbi:response regulator [Sorangium sp. So ce1097]|uniref:response regulator n=1 Tax=Sorangium sp. So ce1097 TaxID=3133330 RepID=UPI003F62A338